jgi:hypothetical protein
MAIHALTLLLTACTPSGPGFGGGGVGLPDTGWWRGSTDTAEEPLDDAALFDCMRRADIGLFGGLEPPDIQGGYSVAGELVASDTDYPEGSPTSGYLCISDQRADRSISVRESAWGASSQSTWAEVRGYADNFFLWMELESTDPHDPDCRITSHAVMAGDEVGGDLIFRSATVPVAFDDCEAYDPDTLGSCWATAARATRTGACSQARFRRRERSEPGGADGAPVCTDPGPQGGGLPAVGC